MFIEGVSSVRSSVGLRFETALDQDDRAAFERALAPLDAAISCWVSRPDIARTFAVAENAAAFELLRIAPGAAVDEPARCVFEITPADAAHVSRLLEALAGAGRPVAVTEAIGSGTSVVVIWDDAIAPLSLLIDLAGVETGDRRRITPLLPLGDRALGQLGAALLGIRDFDERRFIETHCAPAGSKQT
jgi:hypothetical protein